jgi:VWFA-related protein
MQQQPGATPPIVPPDESQQPEDRPSEQKDDKDKPIDLGNQEPTFRSETQLVNIFFNVKDKRGALIPNLRKEDFEISEDGVKQTTKFFSAETNLPLTLGILLDTSASQDRVLAREKEVGAAFFKDIIGAKDMAFIINFDVNVELLQDFTGSVRDLTAAMHRAGINSGSGVNSNIPGVGQGPIPIERERFTALNDAIYLAATEKLAKEVGRKAMVVLTDGQDVGSKTDIKQAIEVAQKSDAICYVLLVEDSGYQYGRGQYHGRDDMKKLTEQTGGRMIEIGTDYDRLKEAFDQIANELRSQYTLAYTPTNQRRDGAFRKIEVKTKAGKVQARRGYYAPLK